MAILWEPGLTPWLDPNGDPYSGLKAFFYDAGTLTPLVTYTDAALSIPNDFPVVADSAGQFPPIFLPEQITYHLRIETAAGVTLRDIDGISSPTTVVPDPPSGGTDTQYLVITGDIKMAWRTSAPTGYVRCNGRTIGGASSGATERANSDCQNLFLFLWTQDANLVVSTGRGATAAGDWAANKTIALPDMRGRVPLGMDSMGNAAANRVTDAQLGADSDLLGAAGGEAAHALTIAELAAHDHGGVTGSGGAHNHGITPDGTWVLGNNAGTSSPNGIDTTPSQLGTDPKSATFTAATDHTHTVGSAGSGTAHNNIAPSVVVPYFIKL